MLEKHYLTLMTHDIFQCLTDLAEETFVKPFLYSERKSIFTFDISNIHCLAKEKVPPKKKVILSQIMLDRI